MMQRYMGVLEGPSTSPLARKAYYTFKNQSSRCNNSNNPSFAHYGKKGISIEYSSRQFVGWFLNNYPFANIGNQEFVVGRINHDENYSLDNLRFETRHESSKEVIDRENRRRKVVLFDHNTGDEIAVFDSAHGAAKQLNLRQGSITMSCQRREKRLSIRKPRMNYCFKYYEEKKCLF